MNTTKSLETTFGAAIGTEAYIYVREKVATWVQEVDQLTTIAETQPHAAYSAFTHGLAAMWNYLSRTVGDLFQPLEDIIRKHFLPTLTGQNTFSDSIRDLTALPPRLGGLGIMNPVKQAELQYHTSCRVTAPLVKHIIAPEQFVCVFHCLASSFRLWPKFSTLLVLELAFWDTK